MLMRMSKLRMCFGKWSKPAKKPQVEKERKSQIAFQDEKTTKNNKAKEELEQKRRVMLKQLQKEQQTTGHIKTQNITFDISKTPSQMRELYQKRLKLIGKILRPKKISEEQKSQELQQKEYTSETIQLLTPNEIQSIQSPTFHQKVSHNYKNVDFQINAPFYEKMQATQTKPNNKRSGLLAYKVGMTCAWDSWGVRHPLTVLQVDRCQVLQIKTPEKDGYSGLQLGLGQANLKTLKKPMIGHFLKHQLAPSKDIREFQCSQDNVLPVGFMITARHFTPGQYIDITSTTNGKGFQGAMKRHHFKGQRASHGNSLSHRALGSTGNRQGGGSRVYKNKHMAGRMGGQKQTILSLQVYKIDAVRNLIYVKGSVGGRAGGLCMLRFFFKGRDGVMKYEKNEQFLQCPTWIPEKQGVYADEIMMKAGENDPFEKFLHDNDVID